MAAGPQRSVGRLGTQGARCQHWERISLTRHAGELKARDFSCSPSIRIFLGATDADARTATAARLARAGRDATREACSRHSGVSGSAGAGFRQNCATQPLAAPPSSLVVVMCRRAPYPTWPLRCAALWRCTLQDRKPTKRAGAGTREEGAARGVSSRAWPAIIMVTAAIVLRSWLRSRAKADHSLA